MKRFIVGLALTAIASSSGHAFAQERVARVGSNKPARTTQTAHAKDESKPAPQGAPVATTSSGDGSTLKAPTDAGYLSSPPDHDLADVRTHEATTTGSGTERTIAVVVTTETKISRTLATPRLLRRMKADQTVAKLAEDFRACYAEDPAQKNAASAIVRVEVQADGSIDQASVESGATATPKINACIFSTAVGRKFAAPGGSGTAVLVQIRTR
jgi:hypothetical protein